MLGRRDLLCLHLASTQVLKTEVAQALLSAVSRLISTPCLGLIPGCVFPNRPESHLANEYFP